MESNDDLFEDRKDVKEEAQVVFTRYNREERLKTASEKVRRLHDSTFIERKGIIKTLTSNKGSRSVFFVIIILVILNLFFFFIFTEKSSGKIYGIKTDIQAFLYQNKVLANIRLAENANFIKDESSQGEIVKIQFSFFDKDKNKIKTSITEGIYTGSEIRFSASEDSGTAKKLQVHVLIKNKMLILNSNVK